MKAQQRGDFVLKESKQPCSAEIVSGPKPTEIQILGANAKNGLLVLNEGRVPVAQLDEAVLRFVQLKNFFCGQALVESSKHSRC